MTGFLDMPVVGEGGTDIGDNIPYSLMLDSGASQYLSWTPSVAGNRKTWEFTTFVKRCKTDNTIETILSAVGDTIRFNDDAPGAQIRCGLAGGVVTFVPQHREPIGHFHLRVVLDTTNETPTERIRVYINRVRASVQSGSWPALNADGSIGNTVLHTLGCYNPSPQQFFGGYLSVTQLMNGQASADDATTRISTDTGQCVNKTYTGSFGTNGFKLTFANSANLGEDTSGNGNHWTLNGGINSTNQTTDTPSSLTTGNACVLNALSTGRTLSKGNLSYAGASSGIVKGTLGVSSGKWYAEYIAGGSGSLPGICSVNLAPTTSFLGGTSDSWGYAASTGVIYNNGSSSAYGATFTTGDTIGMALDMDAGTLVFYKNGVSQGTAATGLTGTLTFGAGSNSTNCLGSFNFGQRVFAYTPPTGFKALCTANLPTPAILNPEKHHYVVTLSKSGDTSFTLPWSATEYDTKFRIKRRDSSGSNATIDGLRGYDKVLFSDTTAAEITDANYIGVSGTTITLKSSLPNGSYVVVCDKAGKVSERQTNTNGSITSTVSANVLSGFSIAVYTGSGANATVGHGLSKALDFNIHKKRSAAVHDWGAWHSAFGGTDAIYLNGTGAKFTDSTVFTAAPTSTVINIGSYGAVNTSGQTYVAYCHHSVEGYSKFGSIDCNGSADGWFAYFGLKPTDLEVKTSTIGGTGYDWFGQDTARDQWNGTTNHLWRNTAAAENDASISIATNNVIDLTAGGAKSRYAGGATNPAGNKLIYSAYGTSIKFATAR